MRTRRRTLGHATSSLITLLAASVGACSGGSEATTAVDTSSCTEAEQRFSFFVASLEALQRESGRDSGFGGDLGGLAGADALCQTIAEYSTPCAAQRPWRAFLSTVAGPVHAKDRIGQGPWYDRMGRLVSMTLDDLINQRPVGADSEILNDLPNEYGVPNHDPDGTGQVDNHDTLTGSGADGALFADDPGYTCNDWTSSAPEGSPRCGHTWPTGTGRPGGVESSGSRFPGGDMGDMAHWISALTEAGCAPFDPDNDLVESGPPDARNPTVGSGGGYGGFYCFALPPE